MLVKMRKWELKATEAAKRFTKAWDYFAVFSDAYSLGRQDALSQGEMSEQVEVEINDGSHQLAISSFQKWEEENRSLPFKEAMKLYMIHYNIMDIRVDEDKDGNISFQGTCKKK